MAAIHTQSVKTSVPPSHFQMTTNGVYFALPHNRNAVGVWAVEETTCKILELEGHRKKISALCFGHSQMPTLICSAAEDYVIVWNVDLARSCSETGRPIRGQIISTLPGDVRYISFSFDDDLVAACMGRNVMIMDSKKELTKVVLEGHTSQVNCAEFCPHYSHTIITAGDDRTFMVWDFLNETLVYQSSIISSSPFLCLAMNPIHESFSLGSADGKVRIYDLTDGNGFRNLHCLDISKLHKKVQDQLDDRKLYQDKQQGPKVISSRPTWQRSEHQSSVNEPQHDEGMSAAEIECSVLGIMYRVSYGASSRAPTPTHLPFLQSNQSLVKDLMKSPPMLVVATTGCVLQVNAATLEPSAYTSLQEPIQSSNLMEQSTKVLSWAGNAALAIPQESHNDQRTVCLLGSCFHNEVHVVNLSVPNKDTIAQIKSQLSSKSAQYETSNPVTGNTVEIMSEQTTSFNGGESQRELSPSSVTSAQYLSLLSSAPLTQNSPLKEELVLKTKSKKESVRGGKSKPGIKEKKGQILDNQPIVFNQKVKSSGYAAEEPRRVMFQPRTSNGRSTKPIHISKSAPANLAREYPIDAPAPTELRTKVDVAERPTAVNSVTFSGDGCHCACGLANNSAQVFKMPLSGGKGFALAGHTGIVNNVAWSHDNKWLLTTSEDKTASVWSFGMPDPIMTFSLQKNNFGSDKEGGLKPTTENPSFSRAVRFGQFYYVDKFIMLTSGNSFYMYKCHLDTAKSDIKRYLSSNRYKLVVSHQMDQAQQITAFKTVNAFHSYLAICAGSDKSLGMFDMNVGQSVRSIIDAHTRAAHSIALNEGSAYVSHVPSAYDLFATAAAGDCIKLWDMRASTCVRRYEGHMNRAHPCGVAISPCSRFIASGSEDRSAYIFDIRASTFLHKLTGHTDTVSDVAFHPLHPVLVTATLDGKLRIFSAVK